MEYIKDMLYEGNHSLVLKTDTEEVFAFDGRGISDLMQLLSKSPDMLRGAILADKVVGKAAAALMILGDIKAVYADTISEPALHFFESVDLEIDVNFHHQVEYISNRTKTGWCPMELACKDAKTPEECLENIKAKLSELSKKQ